MIPGKIIAGDEELSFQIPTDWHEVTFWQLLQLNAMQGEGTALEELSILSGVPLSIWNDVPAIDAQAWSVKLQTALLANDAPQWDELTPAFTFQLGRRMITIPDKIEKCPAGAVESIRAILLQHQQEDKNDIPAEDLILCFAMVCVKPYFGTFGDDGEEKAEKLADQVKGIPAVIAHPTVNFFFNVWQKKPPNGPTFWQALLKRLSWQQE